MTPYFTAQHRDWSGGWVGDGVMCDTARDAYHHCLGVLVKNGYSGVDVRVIEHTTTTSARVVDAASIARSDAAPHTGGPS